MVVLEAGGEVESLLGKKILLVEDERIIAMSEEHILMRYGFEVVTVGTGEAAIATMDSRDDIDLILMDINLSAGMDGTEAAQQILAHHDVPLIFISSHTEREIVERTEGITSYGYIVKNSGETVLIASVKMAFRLWYATLNERAHERALRAEKALLDAAAFSRAVGDAMPALVYLYDADEGRNIWVNRRHREFFSPIVEDSTDLAFEDIVALIHEDDLPALFSIHEKMTSDPACDQGEVEIRMRVRRIWRWMLVMLTAFRRDADGRLIQTMGTLFDISKRKKAELELSKANRRLVVMVRQRDLLLREVNHRVKNNLLMVHSLLSLRESAANLDLTDVKNQVISIGLVHELLHGGEDITRVDAREYVSRIMDSVFGQGATVEMNVDPVELPASLAVPVGLLVNEIATNASRHAFVDGFEHVFSLELTADHGAGGFYVLTASNTGRRFPSGIEPATASTLGLRLITALVGQLGGTLDLHREPITRFIIRFPIRDEDSDDSA